VFLFHAQVPFEIETHSNGGHGNHRGAAAFLVNHVEAALHNLYRHLAMRQTGAHTFRIDHVVAMTHFANRNDLQSPAKAANRLRSSFGRLAWLRAFQCKCTSPIPHFQNIDCFATRVACVRFAFAS